jgi:phytoene synthase
MEFEALRARGYYSAARELLPMIEEDSQAALWTLVEIYQRLLEKIIARNYDVFTERVRLGTAEKLSVMSKGFWRRI